MLQHRHAASLDLAFARGMAAGQSYARAVLTPGYPLGRRPRNPYWCLIRAFTWKLGFALGSYDVLNDGR